MNPSKFMDKQITELSPSTIHDFPYFSDLHEEEDEEDHLFPSSNFLPIRPLPNSSSMDCFDSAKAAHEKVGTSYDGALISVVDKKMKEHTDTFLHVVDGLITRLSQLESRTRNIESYVDELKASTEYNHGRTNGKLKQLENTLRED
ncbi:uncharacterized protein LOC117903928 isoform X2 [Vitis riparia]|uniref:uncharacterized protein LOC117903928 isoform X2 n=1 Tax=Vitis riparia TaxID=96939 RepID=UPI00155A5A2C|nr:uncharacterized protein LOC117903928 isoform X2 [Vitis riparia]